MKALSLRQPWAWAVLHAGKTLENRRWNTRFRGEFLIHAAKGCKQDEYLDACDFIADTKGWLCSLDETWPCLQIPRLDAMQRGGIVGRARLVDVIPPCGTETLFSEPCAHPWHMPGQFAFVLEDIEVLPFISYAGSLSFFGVSPEVERAVLAARGAA